MAKGQLRSNREKKKPKADKNKKIPIGRHIIRYRPLVLTSGAIGIRAMPIRAPTARAPWPADPLTARS